jgi:Xaa-Pro dipeptidase
VLVCPSEELVFFAGFSPMMCKRFQGLFIKNDGSYFYLCNLLYAGEIKNHMSGVEVYTWFDGDDMAVRIKEILDGEGLLNKTIGLNWAAPAFSVLDIADKTGIKFVNAKPLLEEMRIIKTDDEIENLRKAAAITDKVFSDLLEFIRPGMIEADVKGFIFSQMEKHGGTGPWAIVARGANSSFPHYQGSDGVIEKQDVILLDFGCTFNDMRSDMSRTIFVGGITDEQREVYDICRKSTEAGQAACFEGAFIPDIDRVCRDIITEAGYGEFFVNRVGHGIGYMGHEAPDIKASNPRRLEKGMCFSIEPGINLTGKFGMRIENIIAITENGAESLNKSTHEIVII